MASPKKKAEPKAKVTPIKKEAVKKGSTAHKTSLVDVHAKYCKPITRERIPTGIIVLDQILGGGVPVGSIIEHHCKSGGGKTTLWLQALRKMMESYNYTTSYIDAEAAVRNIVDKLNITPYIDSGQMRLFNEVGTYSQLDEIFTAIVNEAGERHVVVIDSISNINADVFMDESITKNDIASNSKILTRFFQKYKVALLKKKITLILINQTRANIQVMPGLPGPAFRPGGGQALEFYPDIRIEMKMKEHLKKKIVIAGKEQDVVIGNIVDIKCIKNKTAPGNITLRMPILWGVGASNVLACAQVLIDKDYAAKSNGYIYHALLQPEGTAPKNYREAQFNIFVRDNYPALYTMLFNDGAFELQIGDSEDNSEIEEAETEEPISEEE